MKKAISYAVYSLLLIALFLVSGRSLLAEERAGALDSTNSATGDYVVTMKVNKMTFELGEDITVGVKLQNTSSDEKTFYFASSYQADYTIGQYRWSADKIFTQATTSITLDPNEIYNWTFTHDVSENPLAVGKYIVAGEVMSYGSGSMGINIVEELEDDPSPIDPQPTIVCDYAAPPEGCEYVQGSAYDPSTHCGMVLSCTTDSEDTSDPEETADYDDTQYDETADSTNLDPEESTSDEGHDDGSSNTSDGQYSADPEYDAEGYVEVKATRLNVRRSWSTSAEQFDLIENGEKYKKIGESNGWVNIELDDGSQGWVYGQYVASTDHSGASSVTNNYTNTATSNGGNTTAGGENLVVTASRLNVRNEGSLSAQKIGLVENGNILKRVEVRNNWMKVILPSGSSGWVHGDYVKEVGEETTTVTQTFTNTSGESVTVTATLLNARTGPGLNNEILTRVKAGDNLRKTGEYNNWLSVELPDGGSAWVHGDYVK
jgi:uncharacterized protein YgiM (DUF1202 family)